jgi:transcriptional regulator with XRE-family HTH domain
MLSGYLDDMCRQQGMSLRRLAGESGVSASSLCRWRQGKQTPSVESCRVLADFLAVPVLDVLAMAGHLSPIRRGSLVPRTGSDARIAGGSER